MNFTAITIASVLIASTPFAEAQVLNEQEILSVRAVLRSVQVDEALLSNQDIENLRALGTQQQLQDSKNKLFMELRSGNASLTCGTGTHGGKSDPVGRGY